MVVFHSAKNRKIFFACGELAAAVGIAIKKREVFILSRAKLPPGEGLSTSEPMSTPGQVERDATFQVWLRPRHSY
jgi:hypothetical protein